jgi:lysozyme family protein
MADFKKSVTYLLGLEGGYTKSKFDRGGATKYGITEKWLQEIMPALNIKDLTLETAREIYHDHFWKPLRLDELQNQTLADEILEMCVNVGRETGVKLVQLALRFFHPEIAVDGIIGPRTIGYLNGFKYPDALVKLVDWEQIRYYIAIVQNDKTQMKNFIGWLNRA